MSTQEKVMFIEGELSNYPHAQPFISPRDIRELAINSDTVEEIRSELEQLEVVYKNMKKN